MSIIPYSKQSINDDDLQAIIETAGSNFLTQGPKIEHFEIALAEYFKVGHAVCCSSGTAALHLAYSSLGVDETSVGIVPAITFAATANAYRYLGSKVIFCDVNRESGLICTNHLRQILINAKKESENQKLYISPVSFAGRLAPLEDCLRLANEFGCTLIEDASHSIGSWEKTYDGNPLASGSCTNTKAACLSFHPVKHLCCGEGGAVLTNSSTLANSAKTLRSHGIVRPFDDDHETPWFYEQLELGWNYRMTDLQAALGISQLSRIDDLIGKRKKIAKLYDQAFGSSEFKKLFERPKYHEGHSWHLYVIRFKNKLLRNQAYKFLRDQGIMTQVHYIPVYRHPYYQRTEGKIHLPGAEAFYSSCLSIPIFPDLEIEEQRKVIEALRKFGTKKVDCEK